MRVLSKQDAVSLLELIHSSVSCKDEADLIALVEKLRSLLPFDFAVCGCARQGGEGVEPYRVINISYPAEWLRLYVERRYDQVDPIFRENFSRFGLQDWARTYRRDRPPKEFLNTAEEFGLVRGYSYGLRDLRGTQGSLFSFSGKTIEPNGRTETILESVAPHLSQALHRVAGRWVRNAVLLSPREVEVLNWVRQGKSNWDISVILGISERTVKFHVRNIMQKLDVVSRAHAAAVAIQFGLIDIE